MSKEELTYDFSLACLLPTISTDYDLFGLLVTATPAFATPACFFFFLLTFLFFLFAVFYPDASYMLPSTSSSPPLPLSNPDCSSYSSL